MNLNLNDLIKLAYDIDEKLYGPKSNEILFRHLSEESDELKTSLNDGLSTSTEERFEQLKELGDVLFCILSIARQNELDLNYALSLTITKLQERIKYGLNE